MSAYHFLASLNLAEGVNDPGIFKAVFLVGGPGSGKSYVADQLFGFNGAMFSSRFGLRLINSDTAFEKFMHQAGISLKALAEPEVLARVNTPSTGERDRAKRTTNARQNVSTQGRLGLVIDGTGKDASKLLDQRKRLEELGYETYLVFVNASLENALDRNRKRERTLPDEFIKETWEQVQSNIPALQQAFGDQFYLVTNDDRATAATEIARVEKALAKQLLRPANTPEANQWIANARSAGNSSKG